MSWLSCPVLSPESEGFDCLHCPFSEFNLEKLFNDCPAMKDEEYRMIVEGFGEEE